MSLAKLLHHYDKAKYRPHSLRLDTQGLFPWELLSPPVQQFLYLLFQETAGDHFKPGPDRFSLHLLAMIPNVSLTSLPSVRDAYEDLSDDEKMEVLGFFTFPIHEHTHHIDYLTTPFGVTYHLHCCAEYIAMQRFIPTLIKQQGWLPSKPLAYCDEFLSPDLSTSWDNVKGWVRFFNAYRGAPAYRIKDHDSVLVKLFGKALRYCSVDSTLESVRIPQAPKRYLRPETLLESRAVIHSLLYILFLFGKTEAARAAIRLYLGVYYPATTRSGAGGPTDHDLDYTFLFELCAPMFIGIATFVELLEKAPMLSLDSWLRLIDGVTWYALQAPPRSDNADGPVAGPVERFLLALMHLEDHIRTHGRLNHDSAVGLLNEMDTSEWLRRHGCLPIHECLDNSLTALRDIRCHNTNIGSQSLRNHFRHVFKAQTYFLRERSKYGYNDLLGLPENGNVFSGIRGREAIDHLVLHYAKYGYTPKADVKEWFTDRENLLFCYLHKFESKELFDRLQSRFLPLVPVKLVACVCGAQITGEIPPGVRRYRAKCWRCGKVNQLKQETP
jgi:hypothetical protein